MRKVLAYFVSAAVASGVPFLLSIVLARYLSVADAGLIALYTTQAALAGILVGFGAYASVQARFFIDRDRLGSYLGATAFLHAALLAASALVLLLFQGAASAWASLPLWALFVALGVAFMQAFINMDLLLSQAQGWATRFLMLQFAQAALLAVLAPVLAIGFSLGWRGFVCAQVVQLLIVAPYSVRVLVREFGMGRHFRRSELRANLRFGLGLLPHSLAGFVIVGYDRVYVGAQDGADAAGVYSVLLQIGMLVSMIMAALNKVYTPWMYARLKDPADWARIGQATWLGIAAIAALCAVVGPLAHIGIVPLLGSKYAEGLPLVAWVVLGGALNAAYLLVTNLVFYSERMVFLSVATVSGALAKWLCLPALYRDHGLQGAAMSNVVGLAVCMLLTMAFAVHLYDRRVLFGPLFGQRGLAGHG
jgi:O-antigen/teichoic acid export membrane protein